MNERASCFLHGDFDPAHHRCPHPDHKRVTARDTETDRQADVRIVGAPPIPTLNPSGTARVNRARPRADTKRVDAIRKTLRGLLREGEVPGPWHDDQVIRFAKRCSEFLGQYGHEIDAALAAGEPRGERQT